MSLLTAGDLNPFDAFRLIKLIYNTAHKARVHRETCTEFASYLSIIDNLLAPLQTSPQLGEHAAVRDALMMLHRSLVKAFLLIQKCERTSTLSAMLKHVPRQLKELEGEIQKILSLLNLANLHVNLITTNGSNVELNKAGILSLSEVASASLGVSHSLQETKIEREDIPIRSFSVPSTSGQGLATAVPSKLLSITWGEDERYWRWVARRGSRFSEVAYLVDASVLEVQGQVNTSILRPGTYTLSWRLQVACLEDDAKPSGWESEPILFEFSTSDGHQHAERASFLASTSDNKVSNLDTCRVRGSTDGWMEYDVGTFTVHKKQSPVKLTFSMNEVNGGWKRGLFLDGVLITPRSVSYDAIISPDGSQSVTDLSTLPAFLFFSGHPHELKFMRDPYWYSCRVCESPEQGVGYHCQRCGYNAHPQCCISDHQFAALLASADSELSHWHWATLLQLQKHRLEEKASRPKTIMFRGHSHRLKLTQNPHPSFICDAGDCDGQGWVYRGWDGWVYHCEECNFDVHPECRYGGRARSE